MHDFTPFSALAGGALIGLASVWLLAANGRIAGVSGILYGLFSPSDWRWRAAFVAGLVLAGVAWQAAGAPLALREGFPPMLAAASGLLVGIGTSLGGGCTSGHGVCGLGRRSARSLVAVIVFMAAGMASTYVFRHLLGVAS
jgi:uncharacterized membrane protein YedE/YeeE